MRLGKVQLENGDIRVGRVTDDEVRLLDFVDYVGMETISDVLHSDDPIATARGLLSDEPALSVDEVMFLPPIDEQEVWAAGVTYKRSREARERESVGAAHFYDLVYTAERPELFFKATARRVVGPGTHVRIRADSKWSVPEPEFALIVSPRLQIVGYTIGNDMSARDIEGENPLYLPQAKVYDGSCGLGPVVALADDDMPTLPEIAIRLIIERGRDVVFEGNTNLAQMARNFSDLVTWLGRDNSFPHGVVLLTGTGIVPADDFALRAGDRVHIDISGIGRLSNVVAQSER
ncbi:MAG TPA: fumarylacetoacetate hydrolase family protein [Candidatus Cybelea sp.]|nr:fumarylacetoacetate hydrolase family protein [Candidatus Cybelea sp.]